MVTLTIALRSLARRKIRMLLIALLVFLGTILIVFGETFSLSAKRSSRSAIINYFTGDLVIYSDKSKEKPSPFSFTTPLPPVPDPARIESWLAGNDQVDTFVSIAQNYGILSVERDGRTTDVPFFFYAVDPEKYSAMFRNIAMKKGTFFKGEEDSTVSGVVLSMFQLKNYAENYSIDLQTGDAVRLLSLSGGGSVNAVSSRIIGTYEPRFYKNVFNYINFLDIKSYSRLYNFTGVETSSMPASFNNALSSESDDDIFGLAQSGMGKLDTRRLVASDISGFSMIAVRLKENSDARTFTDILMKQGFGVKVVSWSDAAGFFAYIAGIIQGVIYGATFLVFLVVVFILMNTLIINVLERTGEIGTLRAMGAEKSFIAAEFLWESFLLNGTAAVSGIAASTILITASGGSLVLPDVLQQYLVGGGPLILQLSARPFVEAFALIIIVSLLATLYPIRVATSVTPLKAMSGN
jgi:ABC-type lipoprotein release transport system permease subunit